MKWEYAVYTIDVTTTYRATRKLNVLGEQRWEFLEWTGPVKKGQPVKGSYGRVYDAREALFKRPKVETEGEVGP